jgi:hypothetical protein
MTDNSNPSRKKSSRWPIGLAITYISFMVILIGIVVFSTYNQVDLVVDDYYEKELKYQQQIDRINRAKALSEPVSWHYDKTNKHVTIHFPDDINAKNIRGNILFFRPSDATQDKIVALRLSPDNLQTISTQHLVPGLWKIKIFWQENQKDFYTEGILVI